MIVGVFLRKPPKPVLLYYSISRLKQYDGTEIKPPGETGSRRLLLTRPSLFILCQGTIIKYNRPGKTRADTNPKGRVSMNRVYNFAPGPSMLPEAALSQAAAELLSYGGAGMSETLDGAEGPNDRDAWLSGPEHVCELACDRPGWVDFNTGVRNAPEGLERVPGTIHDPMLMYFSSGTSGNRSRFGNDSYGNSSRVRNYTGSSRFDGARQRAGGGAISRGNGSSTTYGSTRNQGGSTYGSPRNTTNGTPRGTTTTTRRAINNTPVRSTTNSSTYGTSRMNTSTYGGSMSTGSMSTGRSTGSSMGSSRGGGGSAGGGARGGRR